MEIVNEVATKIGVGFIGSAIGFFLLLAAVMILAVLYIFSYMLVTGIFDLNEDDISRLPARDKLILNIASIVLSIVIVAGFYFVGNFLVG